MKEEFWKSKLTSFDSALFRMVESLTELPCEPKNGGNHYFLEVDYSKHKDPDYISAIYDAIAGRMGSRLIKIDDDPDRNCLMVYVNFAPQDFPKLM